MLISHRKEFIFTKTQKTAGTSVESYFEKFCMPKGVWQESHAREEYTSDNGIIGYRGERRAEVKPIWYSHMPAKDIRDLIGRDIWDQYFKFTIIRNPFDKLISGFHMHLKMDHKIDIFSIDEGKEIEVFRLWIQAGNAVIDRNKYLIEEKECVDYFIKFEALHSGIKYVCDRINVPYEQDSFPEFKKGIRLHRIDIKDYFDEKTEAVIRKKYAWEFERFGYSMPE